MSQESDTESAVGTDKQESWSRRTLLKVSGVGIGLATVLGTTATGDEHEDGDDGGSGNETDGGDSAAVFDDLIDPVWGYPLAADEAGAVSINPTVEARTEEGEGAHPDFPVDPRSGEAFPAEFVFDPVGVHLHPGDLVKFHSTAGEHTATAFHEKYSNPNVQVPTRIPEGVPGFTSPPIVDGEAWLYEFPRKGVYDVLCLPHVSFGMVMRAVVFDPEEDDIESDAFSVQEVSNLPPNIVAVLTAEELEPANIIDAGTVSWADLTLEVPQPTPTSTPTNGNATNQSG